MELYINYVNNTNWLSYANISDTLYRTGTTIVKTDSTTITLVFKSGW